MGLFTQLRQADNGEWASGCEKIVQRVSYVEQRVRIEMEAICCSKGGDYYSWVDGWWVDKGWLMFLEK